MLDDRRGVPSGLTKYVGAQDVAAAVGCSLRQAYRLLDEAASAFGVALPKGTLKRLRLDVWERYAEQRFLGGPPPAQATKTRPPAAKTEAAPQPRRSSTDGSATPQIRTVQLRGGRRRVEPT